MKCRLLILNICFVFVFSIVELNNNVSKHRPNRNTQSEDKFQFQDIINEIRTLKINLFGDPEENMDFYKRNKKAYDPKIIQKMTKIGKVLELEELLEYYNKNSNLK